MWDIWNLSYLKPTEQCETSGTLLTWSQLNNVRHLDPCLPEANWTMSDIWDSAYLKPTEQCETSELGLPEANWTMWDIWIPAYLKPTEQCQTSGTQLTWRQLNNVRQLELGLHLGLSLPEAKWSQLKNVRHLGLSLPEANWTMLDIWDLAWSGFADIFQGQGRQEVTKLPPQSGMHWIVLFYWCRASANSEGCNRWIPSVHHKQTCNFQLDLKMKTPQRWRTSRIRNPKSFWTKSPFKLIDCPRGNRHINSFGHESAN